MPQEDGRLRAIANGRPGHQSMGRINARDVQAFAGASGLVRERAWLWLRAWLYGRRAARRCRAPAIRAKRSTRRALLDRLRTPAVETAAA